MYQILDFINQEILCTKCMLKKLSSSVPMYFFTNTNLFVNFIFKAYGNHKLLKCDRTNNDYCVAHLVMAPYGLTLTESVYKIYYLHFQVMLIRECGSTP